MLFRFRFVLVFMIHRITSRCLITQIRSTRRFCGFGIKITRLSFAFCSFVVQDRRGRIMLTPTCMVEDVNCTRRVFLRNVRRMCVNLGSQARPLIIILFRLRKR